MRATSAAKTTHVRGEPEPVEVAPMASGDNREAAGRCGRRITVSSEAVVTAWTSTRRTEARMPKRPRRAESSLAAGAKAQGAVPAASTHASDKEGMLRSGLAVPGRAGRANGPAGSPGRGGPANASPAATQAASVSHQTRTLWLMAPSSIRAWGRALGGGKRESPADLVTGGTLAESPPPAARSANP